MNSDLKGIINIGKDTETKLIQVGIDSFKNFNRQEAKKLFCFYKRWMRELV